MIKQLPVTLPAAQKGDVRTQIAALCYRVRNGKVQVLLVTSRGAGRWIVPKGWPMHGKTPAAMAEIEAWEEGGVRGRCDGRCLGVYSYSKQIDGPAALPCLAMVYPVEVRDLARDYPEKSQRKRKWMSRKRAAKLVDEPELSRILRDFDPRVRA